MSLSLWALWGLLGAFVYAAPRLVASLFDQARTPTSMARAIAGFLIAVATGPIIAAALGPVISTELNRRTEAECRAVALFVGILVNPVAPAAVQLLTDVVLARLGHPLAKRTETQ